MQGSSKTDKHEAFYGKQAVEAEGLGYMVGNEDGAEGEALGISRPEAWELRYVV